MLGDKFRFRFSKAGVLRLLSHHDLMRCAERLLRRAGLPFKSTGGFHPGPRIVFALSLPLGVVGRSEVMELELTGPFESEDVLARVNTHAPDGLTFSSLSVVPMKTTAIPRRVVYTLPLPPDRVEAVAAACRELTDSAKFWADRQKPNPKRLNIRPYFRSLRVDDTELKLDFWVTGTGTARADEVIRLLHLTDLLDAGAVLSRDELELRDEVTTPDPLGGPPDGPAETLPPDPAAFARPNPDHESQPAEAHWGASPSGPVVE